MERKELLNSKEYWVAFFKAQLANAIQRYMDLNGLNEDDIAEKLVLFFSKTEIIEILDMEIDLKNISINKLINSCLFLDIAPVFEFKDIKTLN